MNGKTIDIMLTGSVWHANATATSTTNADELSDYSESALAAKVFQARPDCDVVAVLDGAGRLIRTIHRNTA